MESWLSGMKNLGSNRMDSDLNTLKCIFFRFKLALTKCFGCFGGLFGLIFFLVGRQILKSIYTITGKFVLKVVFIYVCTRRITQRQRR